MKRALMLAAVVGLLLTGVHARAADETVELQILVIRATTSNTDISPELKGIAEQLKKQFKYTGYKLEKKHARKVKLDETYQVDLPGNYKARLTPTERKDDRIQLKLEVVQKRGDKEEPKLRTVVRLREGKAGLFGGLSLGGGDVLILAVSAK